jgi:hypothetical protein
MSIKSGFQGIMSGLTRIGEIIIDFIVPAKTKREHIAMGIYQYQPFVYPAANSLFGTAQATFSLIWTNLSEKTKYLPNWDFLHYTSNVTGMVCQKNQDVNGVFPYSEELDIHGHHDLIVVPVEAELRNNPLTYSPHLSGTMEYLNFDIQQPDYNLIHLSDYPKRVVWSWPFLVKPHTEPKYEDTTRIYGIHVIIVDAGCSLFLYTAATSIFYLPGTAPYPSWYTNTGPKGRITNVLNVLMVFCATIQDDEKDCLDLTNVGTPVGMVNREVVTTLMPCQTNKDV